ncbi:MAG: hypothetical protein WC147_10950 [Syntrophomonas sp.]|jgi:hypothetical protein
MKIEMNGKKYYAQFEFDHPRAAPDRPVLLLDVGNALVPHSTARETYWIEGTEAERLEFGKWKEKLTMDQKRTMVNK